MPYDIRLPDGRLVRNIPDDMSHEEAFARILKNFPELSKSQKRTWGEALSDTAASVGSGLAGLAQLPSQISTLISGEDITGTGAGLQDIQNRLQAAKSPILQGREALRQQEMQKAAQEGVLSEFGTAIKSTMKDPALLSSFLAEQVPQMIPAAGVGRGAKALSMLGKAGEEAAVRRGVGAAIGTAAVQQGADVGSDTVQAAMSQPDEVWAQNPRYRQLVAQGVSPNDAKRSIAVAAGRLAAAEAGAISVGAQRLPGGQTLERALVGSGGRLGAKGIAGGLAKGAVGEGLSEAVEEGGGQFSKNVNLADINPAQSLKQGVGSAAGMGAVGGIGLGGLGGAIEGRAHGQELARQSAEEQAKQQELAAQQAEVARQQQEQQALQQKQLADQQAAEAAQRQALIDEQARKTPQRIEDLRRAAELAPQSAFNEAQPDMFGHYMPEQAQPSQVVTPPAAPVAQPGQMELPLGDEQGQLSLFPGMVENAPAAAPAPQVQTPETMKLGAEDFDRLGFSRHAALRKRLDGVDLMTLEGRAKFINEMDKAGERGLAADWKEVERFTNALPLQGQERLGLTGGQLPTQANNVRAFNTEAPQNAVRQRYDANGNRIIPPHPSIAQAKAKEMADRAALEQEQNNARQFAFGARPAAPAPVEQQAQQQRTRDFAFGRPGAAPVDSNIADQQRATREFAFGQPAGGAPIATNPRTAANQQAQREFAFGEVSPADQQRATRDFAFGERNGNVPDAGRGQPSVGVPVQQGEGAPAQPAAPDRGRVAVPERNADQGRRGAKAEQRALAPAPTKQEAPPAREKKAKPQYEPGSMEDVAHKYLDNISRDVKEYAQKYGKTHSTREDLIAIQRDLQERAKAKAEKTGNTREAQKADLRLQMLDMIEDEAKQLDAADAAAEKEAIRRSTTEGPAKGSLDAAMASLHTAPKAEAPTEPVVREPRQPEKAKAPNPFSVKEARSVLGRDQKSARERAMEVPKREEKDDDVFPHTGETNSLYIPDDVRKGFKTGRDIVKYVSENPGARYLKTVADKLLALPEMTDVKVLQDGPALRAQMPEHVELIERSNGVFIPEVNAIVLRGPSQETAVHEALHAAMVKRVNSDAQTRREFKDLMRTAMKQMKTADPMVYKMFKDRVDGNVHEFITYGFTDYIFRSGLESLRMGGPAGPTLWQRFINLVKSALGFGSKDTQALTDVMNASLERALGKEAGSTEGGAGAHAQVTNSPTQQLYDRTKRLGLPADTNESFIDKVVNGLGKVGTFFSDPAERQGIVDYWRTKIAYSGAAVESKLKKEYNGAVRDALGELRPDINLAQALHADNLSVGALLKGRLELDKSTGLWKATDDANNMSSVFQKVHALEQKIGEDEARHAVQVYLLAARSDALNKANAHIERQAQALESAGKKKAADKLRDDKLKHVHLTQDEIDAGLEYAKYYPELRDILSTYTAFKNNMIDSMVTADRFSREQAQDLKDGIDYVPFNRVMEEEEAQSGPKGYFRGLTDLGRLHKFSGSERPVDNILDNMVKLSMWMGNNAVRNHAAVRLANALAIHDNSGKLIARDAPARGGNWVPIFLDGRRKFVELEDALDAEAFKGTESVSLPIVQTLAKFSDILRKGTTMMPNFLVSQVMQDAMRAYTMSGTKNPAKVAGKTLTSFMGALKGKDPLLAEMESYGIAGAYDYNPGQAAAKVEQELGLKRRNALQKFMGYGENVSAASDAAQRRAIYDQTMAESGDKALALYRAMEVINFKRQGTSSGVNVIRRLVPFMNAYIQGMDVLGRSAFGQGISGRERKEAMRMFWMAGMKVAALSLAYSMMMGGDDDYEKQDTRTKMRNFFLPGTDLKLPVPSDVGFFFKAMPELLYNYMASQGTDKEMDSTKLLKAMGNGALDAFLGPTLVPQAVKPMLEVGINHSFFTGNPIIGRGIENKETSQQFTENTSEIAKAIGASGLVSPMNADYLIKGVLGSAGGLALTMMDSLAGLALDNPRPSLPAHRTPIISTFLANPEGRGLLEDYYDLKDRSDTVAATLKSYIEQRNMEGAKEYLEDKKGLLQVRSAVSAISNQIEKLRTMRKAVISDSSLSGEEKRAKLDELDAMQNRMLANVAKMRQVAGL